MAVDRQSCSRRVEIPGLDAQARSILAGHERVATAQRGDVLFQPGQACHQLVLLAQGSVKVRTVSESGREIELYRVAPGETCVLSVACLLGNQDYEAEGIAETDILGLAVDRSLFQQLLAQSPGFRDMVLQIQTRRIHDLIALVDAVAFQGTEARLAAHLIRCQDSDGRVTATHQQIAQEIGTAREVVSRRLKRFEAAGLVGLERGRLRLLDVARMRRIAGEAVSGGHGDHGH